MRFLCKVSWYLLVPVFLLICFGPIIALSAVLPKTFYEKWWSSPVCVLFTGFNLFWSFKFFFFRLPDLLDRWEISLQIAKLNKRAAAQIPQPYSSVVVRVQRYGSAYARLFLFDQAGQSIDYGCDENSFFDIDVQIIQAKNFVLKVQELELPHTIAVTHN